MREPKIGDRVMVGPWRITDDEDGSIIAGGIPPRIYLTYDTDDGLDFCETTASVDMTHSWHPALPAIAAFLATDPGAGERLAQALSGAAIGYEMAIDLAMSNHERAALMDHAGLCWALAAAIGNAALAAQDGP